MIRTVITPTDTNIILSIPEDYVGKPVEITFLALDELKSTPAITSNWTDKFKGAMTKQPLPDIDNQLNKLRNQWE